MVSFTWRSSTGVRTGPTAATPWPLASKPKAAGGAGDVEATMAADAASATVKFARRINGSRNISRGISESSSPRISSKISVSYSYQIIATVWNCIPNNLVRIRILHVRNNCNSYFDFQNITTDVCIMTFYLLFYVGNYMIPTSSKLPFKAIRRQYFPTVIYIALIS